jgi:biotin carboxyl carrier protein
VRFKIQIDGAEHEIEAGAGGSVGLGGETLEAKVGRPSNDRRSVQLGDKTYEIRVVENCADTGIFVLEVAGERVPLTVRDVVKSVSSKVKPGSGGGAGAGSEAEGGSTGVPAEVKHGVWAPVPGKIVSVLVKPGDKVDEGTPVVVLEAMKMENELHSPAKGTVMAVLVKKGDSADKGQLLVALE